MANLLTRMAARAIGAAPVAQPLVSARYSPDGGLVRSGAPGGAGLEPEIALEAAAAPVTKTPARETPRDATLPKPSEEPNDKTTRRDSPDASPAGSLGAETPATVEHHDWESTATLPASVEHHARELLVTATLPVTPLDGPPIMFAGAPRMAPEAIPSPAPGRPTTTSREAIREGAQPGAGKTVIVPQAGQPVQPVLPARPLMRVTPASPRTLYSRRDQAGDAEPEAPVIRVSIGRVDVRAQFAAATPAPSPGRTPRAAALSLDEYLKQRSEGRR